MTEPNLPKHPIVQKMNLPHPFEFLEKVVCSEVGKIKKTKWDLKVVHNELSPAPNATLKSVCVQTLENELVAEFSVSPIVLKVEAVVYNKQFLSYAEAISKQYKSVMPADFEIIKRW